MWGVGSFDTEKRRDLAKYRAKKWSAARGPLTRNLIRMSAGRCAPVYDDPAILVPDYHPPVEEHTYELGLVLRCPKKLEPKIQRSRRPKIFFETDEIEKTLDGITSCKRILTLSLHGLIIADAYGIPNCWLASDIPKGIEFKYYDYFLAAEKPREPTAFAPLRPGHVRGYATRVELRRPPSSNRSTRPERGVSVW